MQPQPWVKERAKALNKTLVGLGRAMGGLDGSRITEIIAGTRRVQPAEVAPMAEYLEVSYEDVYERLFGVVHKSIPKGASHRSDTTRIDHTATVLIPYWEVTAPGDGSGVTLALIRTESWVSAPQDLRLSESAFAVQAWDESNEPWVRRGSTLFVKGRQMPRNGQWGLFCRSGNLDAGTIESPLVGILLARKGASWLVQIGLTKVTLAMADYPLVWLIEFIKP